MGKKAEFRKPRCVSSALTHAKGGNPQHSRLSVKARTRRRRQTARQARSEAAPSSTRWPNTDTTTSEQGRNSSLRSTATPPHAPFQSFLILHNAVKIKSDTRLPRLDTRPGSSNC